MVLGAGVLLASLILSHQRHAPHSAAASRVGSTSASDVLATDMQHTEAQKPPVLAAKMVASKATIKTEDLPFLWGKEKLTHFRIEDVALGMSLADFRAGHPDCYFPSREQLDQLARRTQAACSTIHRL